ncbi:MAG: hypothetical protein QMD53_02800 [Actinomycetota bacterium]|nr:hypothetical protein [Actinomycetota bacterium]
MAERASFPQTTVKPSDERLLSSVTFSVPPMNTTATISYFRSSSMRLKVPSMTGK